MKLHKNSEWLKNQYIDLEKSTHQIAKLANCTSPTICRWLRKYNILIRKEKYIPRKIKYEINKNNCWVCTSHYRNPDGYPMITRNKKDMNISRYIYCKTHNLKIEDIDGLVICHKCDNPACINPDHLYLGTQLDNIADMIERDRYTKGEQRKDSKLTEKEVLNIRELHKQNRFNQRELARKYQVSFTLISLVINKKIWKHI